jgi:predicted Zn-dependent peptidase
LLQAFYVNYIKSGSVSIIVAGKVGPEQLAAIDDYIGGIPFTAKPVPTIVSLTPTPATELSHRVEMEGTVQCAIRVGKMAVNKPHPDYQALKILNTLLGGYFGSRLMSNIREDKGFTYGIGSALVSLKNSGYYFIASEVGADVCSAAMTEIEKEMAILKKDVVSDEELSLVRNYMLGSMLGSLENALSHADKFKNIYFSGLGYDYYQNYIQTVRNISPEEVLNLANRYLNFDGLQRVIVGKR